MIKRNTNLYYKKIIKEVPEELKIYNFSKNNLLFIFIIWIIYILIEIEIKNLIITDNFYLKIIKKILIFIIILLTIFYKIEICYLCNNYIKIKKNYLIFIFFTNYKHIIEKKNILNIEIEKLGKYSNYQYYIFYQIKINIYDKNYFKLLKTDNRIKIKTNYYKLQLFLDKNYIIQDINFKNKFNVIN